MNREQRNVEKKETMIDRESEKAYQESLNLIYNFFHDESKQIRYEQSENGLYQAAEIICRKMKIELVSYKKLISTVGERFTIEDVARLSNFPCRMILLEKQWYKKDAGPMLVFLQEEEYKLHPVACIPGKWGGYEYQDPVSGIKKRVDAAVAETVIPQGYVFYRPFPNRTINLKELIRFGAGCFSYQDRITYLSLSILITLCGILLPFMTQLIYDKYIGFDEISPLLQLGLVILVCNMATLCFGIVRNFAVFRGISSVKYAIQAAVYDRIFRLPMKHIREYESADLGNRIEGVGKLFDALLNVLLGAVLAAVCSLAYLTVTFRYSSALTMWGILILFTGCCLIAPCILAQNRYAEKQMEAEGKMSSLSYQLIEGAAKLKLAGAENKAAVQYLKKYLKTKGYYTKNIRMQQRISLLKMSITTLLSLSFYYVAIVKETDITMGMYLGFISAFGVFSGSILGLLDALASVSNLRPIYRRVMPLFEKMPEYEEQDRVLDELHGNIEMNHVTFSYREEAQLVLKDISFQAVPGEYIGIVGPSGCGKSTFLKMLLGFEEPQSGKIYYDGHDLSKLNKQELRKKMGVVLQDGRVFAGSIYENITLTAPQVSMERVDEVITQVGLKDDIMKMPMGIHTYLAEGGGTVSGGQQQRILIARAILSNPRILLFDEATSALDNVTQEMVCESLDKLQATRIVIAHRLSTVMKCDRILVMNDGRIEEEGTYEELMKKGGLFYQLASRQI